MAGNTICYNLTDRNRAQPVKNFIGAANYREMFAAPLMWLSLRHNCQGYARCAEELEVVTGKSQAQSDVRFWQPCVISPLQTRDLWS